MIVILQTPALDRVCEAVYSITSVDGEPARMHAINEIIGDLYYSCVQRKNIVDLDDDIQGIYQPFYEALMEVLTKNDIPLLSIVSLGVNGPDKWSLVFILDK